MGDLNKAGLEEIRKRYTIDSDYDENAKYDVGMFQEQADAMRGIDLVQLDEDMRSILDDYGCKIDSAKIILTDKHGDHCEIKWIISVEGEQDKMIMLRSFDDVFGEVIMSNEYFTIPKSMRGKGIAKNLLHAQLQQAKKAGISSIAVHANIDVGGYTWARMGFQPDDEGMNELCSNLGSLIAGESKGKWTDKKTGETIRRGYTKSELKRAKQAYRELSKIWDDNETKGVYRIQSVVEKYSDVLKPAWLGSSWHGSINLRDKQNLKDYEDYLESGKQAQIEEGRKRRR